MNYKHAPMIEKYLVLVESFKEYQLSALLKKIRHKIMYALDTPNFNPRIKPYLLTINMFEKPFENYDPDANTPPDPDSISEIKNIINALYHAENTFHDLEHVDLRDASRSWSDLKRLYQKTIHEAYLASQHLTHLQINFNDIFTEELHILQPIFKKIQDHAAGKPQEPQKKLPAAEPKKETEKPITPYSASHKAGEISGIVVSQLQPDGGDLDYAFIAKFSALIPGYIQDYTNKIQAYALDIQTKEPKLNQKKINELKIAALNVLSHLESLKSGNDFFSAVKYLNYIHIIRHVITLSMSILDQVGEFSDSSQDVIRSQLAELKYELLPALFGLVDKIEDNGLINPGTLSLPLMKQIEPMYNVLVQYASKIVDFNSKGEELLKIQDSRFIAMRLEHTYQRIDKANKHLFTIQKTQKAMRAFYDLLREASDNQLRICQLSAEKRDALIANYKIIMPYMIRLDVTLNDTIIKSLQEEQPSWSTWSANPLLTVLGQWLGDQMTPVLSHEKDLEKLLAKEEKSALFHIELNQDLIDAVHKHSDLSVFAYHDTQNIFYLDESEAIKIVKPEAPEEVDLKEHFDAFFDLLEKNSKSATRLQELHKESKEQLLLHYKIIQPYFSQTAPGLALNILHALGEDQSWWNWATSSLAFINSEQPDDFESIFDQKRKIGNLILAVEGLKAKHKAHKQAEPEADNKQPPNDPDALVFLQDNTGNWLQNPKQLNGDQALDLCQWYRNKRTKLEVARKAYLDLQELLNTHGLAIDGEIKVKCRNLYNGFQAYFMNGVKAEDKNAAIEFDNYLTRLFAGKPVEDLRVEANLLKRLDPHFQVYFTDMDLKWKNRSQYYHQIASDCFAKEHQEKELAIDPELSKRAHFVIKHTKYSKAVKNFRQSLQHTTRYLNKSQGEQLRVHATKANVPYPEIEDPCLVLAQGKQVLAIKRLFNTLFHIEKTIHELEQLNDKSYEYDYVLHIIYSYSHVYEIMELCKGLVSDPHLSLLGTDLLEKAQNIVAIVQEHTESYQSEQPHLSSSNKPVKSNTLWFVLNAFYLSPKHIRSLGKGNCLNPNELEGLHRQAKRSGLIIEKLINDSDNYFKLFLQTPNMYLLYTSLNAKLKEFTSTTHDAVMNNLESFHTAIFEPMMLEADKWEDQLGLLPGKLSDPLGKIILEYYKGLLQPLGLHSKTHIDLVFDDRLLKKRQSMNRDKIANSLQQLENKKQKYGSVEAFHELLNKNASTLSRYNSEDWSEGFKQELSDCFLACLPRLVGLQSKLNPKASKEEADKQLDLFLQSKLKSDDPKLSNIRELTRYAAHYFQGLQASETLAMRTAQEKLDHLLLLESKQETEKRAFIDEYTKEAFKRELKAASNRQIWLQYMDKEYNRELEAHLQTFENQVIEKAKELDDIDLGIRNSLEAHASDFEKRRFPEYYHLDSVRTAIARFKIYLSRCTASDDPLFEDDKTLSAKSLRINEIDTIASDEKKSIKERIDAIKGMVVNDPTFKQTLFAQKKCNSLSLAYLRQCFIGLLEALHLYTPSRKQLTERIINALSTEPTMETLPNRFGLFSEKKSNAGLDPGLPPLPDNPAK